MAMWWSFRRLYYTGMKPKQWAEQEVRRIGQVGRQEVGASKIAADLGRHAGPVRRMTRTMGILSKRPRGFE